MPSKYVKTTATTTRSAKKPTTKSPRHPTRLARPRKNKLLPSHKRHLPRQSVLHEVRVRRLQIPAHLSKNKATAKRQPRRHRPQKNKTQSLRLIRRMVKNLPSLTPRLRTRPRRSLQPSLTLRTSQLLRIREMKPQTCHPRATKYHGIMVVGIQPERCWMSKRPSEYDRLAYAIT